LGERLNGIQEVARSIRVSSTNKITRFFEVREAPARGSLQFARANDDPGRHNPKA
jgi:hypothetical protein